MLLLSASLHSAAVITRRYYTVTRMSQSGPRAKRTRHQLLILLDCMPTEDVSEPVDYQLKHSILAGRQSMIMPHVELIKWNLSPSLSLTQTPVALSQTPTLKVTSKR